MRTFNFDSDSSVYTQVAADLRTVPGWKEAKTKRDVKADLWLVDGRKKGAIPYALLGQIGRTQLVNYYRGSGGASEVSVIGAAFGDDVYQFTPDCADAGAQLPGTLTLKSSMVRTLRTHMQQKGISDEAAGVPTTFVVYPQRLQAEAPDENETGNMPGASMQQAMMERRKKAAAGDKWTELRGMQNMRTWLLTFTQLRCSPGR